MSLSRRSQRCFSPRFSRMQPLRLLPPLPFAFHRRAIRTPLHQLPVRLSVGIHHITQEQLNSPANMPY